jgi:anti-sigma-K factor RskA
MESEAIHDLTGAYALAALDSDETEEFEAHLRHCDRCQDELADLQAVTTSLAYAVPPATVPAALRSRILEQARSERSNVIPFPQKRSSGRTTWVLAAAASVAAAVAIGLGIWAAMLNSDLGAAREARNRLNDALALVGAPGTSHVDLSGQSGSLAVGPSGRGVLVIPGLPKAPEGRTYQAWVIKGTKPSPAGLFLGAGTGTTVVPLTRPVEPGSVVAVTVEPKKGSAQPTQTPFITAKLS